MDSKILEILRLRSDKVALERFRANTPSNAKRMRGLCKAGFLKIKYEQRGKGGASRVGYEITPLGKELLERELPEL